MTSIPAAGSFSEQAWSSEGLGRRGGSAGAFTLGTSVVAPEASGGVGGRMGSAGPENVAQPWVQALVNEREERHHGGRRRNRCGTQDS